LEDAGQEKDLGLPYYRRNLLSRRATLGENETEGRDDKHNVCEFGEKKWGLVHWGVSKMRQRKKRREGVGGAVLARTQISVREKERFKL